MEDMAPKLFEKIKEEFEDNFRKSKEIRILKEKLETGSASCRDAHAYAIKTGELLSEAFLNNISSDILPDGRLYYNIADRIIRPMLEKDFDIVSEYAKDIHEILNKQAKISIGAVKPKLNEDKVKGIIDITSGKEHFDEIAYMLGEPIINFSQCIVDDTVKANAEFQYDAGLSPKIVRTSSGKCCEWCDKLDGVYAYEDIRNTKTDIFKRHRSCICLVEFVANKKIQNVHSKNFARKEEIRKRIENSYTKDKERNKWTRAQAKALQEKLLKEANER